MGQPDVAYYASFCSGFATLQQKVAPYATQVTQTLCASKDRNVKLQKEIERYSKLNGSVITDYCDMECECGGKKFNLYSDDEEGGAYITCVKCNSEIDIENSKKYIENGYGNICNCENDSLNIGVGKSYHAGSDDIDCVYVGAYCNDCGLAGVYVDWQER